MKTQELISWLRDNDAQFVIKQNAIEVFDILVVYTDKQRFDMIDRMFYLDSHYDLIEKVIEYSRTPIDQRKEPTRYRLEWCDELDDEVTERYLRLCTLDGQFFFSDRYDNTHVFRGAFTDSEIEKFPDHIKGAVTCGFLKKIVVEEEN